MRRSRRVAARRWALRDRQIVGAQILFELLPAALGEEERRIDFFEVLRAREGFGAFADQHDVPRSLHHSARGADRVARVREAGDGACGARAAVHDRGVEFVAAFGGEHRAATGVEQRIVFHFTDNGFDGVER
jgi:hypothetical protein